MMLTLCACYFVRVWVRLVFPIEVKFMFVTNKVHIQIEINACRQVFILRVLAIFKKHQRLCHVGFDCGS